MRHVVGIAAQRAPLQHPGLPPSQRTFSHGLICVEAVHVAPEDAVVEVQRHRHDLHTTQRPAAHD